MLEPAQVPRVFQQAFHLMRSGRPGPVLIDLPFDVQMAEIEFDIDTYEPLPVYKPTATRAQADKALDLLCAAKKPLIIAGGGIHNADAANLLQQLAEICSVPVIPTLMGWGAIPDDHPLMAGMVGLQTSHRYGNATLLESDLVLGIGNRWANRHTGSVDVYTEGPQVRARRHRTDPDRPRVLPGPGHRLRRRAHRAANAGGYGKAPLRARRVAESRRLVRCLPAAQAHAAAQDPLRQRAGQAAARLRRDEPSPSAAIPATSAPSACRRSPARSSCTCTSRATGSTAARPARWAGPFPPRWACARPTRSRQVVALSGDYDFQFMIEELAVGAQFKLPYIHVLVNNSYLGLIRQAQRGFDMDYCVQLAFDNINTAELGGYGVDHVAVAEGLGCKALRVFNPEEIGAGASPGPGADAAAPGAGGGRGDPGARHQHLHGHRDRSTPSTSSRSWP